MPTSSPPPSDPAQLTAPSSSAFTRAVRSLAAQDVFILGYFVTLLLAVYFGDGPGKGESLVVLAIDLIALCTGLVLTRGGVLRYGTFLNSFLYRVAVWIPLFLSYFQLRSILPAVSTRAVDAELLALDLKLFGVEPAVAWDRYVNEHTTEWFSFFYFGYFFILMGNILPMLLATKNMQRTAHFSLGLMLVFGLGHLGYTVVPGFGPYRYLEGQFQNELEGGFFWALVKASVEAGGAMKDIFPSLHTAVPTYFTWFSFWHRRALPYRYVWPVLLFVITQIIGATMFLRWHYLIDICAGLTLATFAVFASAKITRWETKRRQKAGIEPVFRPLEWTWYRQPDVDTN